MAHEHVHPAPHDPGPHNHGVWTHDHVFLGHAHDRAEARAKLDAALTAERARLEASAATLGREIAEKTLGRRLAS